MDQLPDQPAQTSNQVPPSAPPTQPANPPTTSQTTVRVTPSAPASPPPQVINIQPQAEPTPVVTYQPQPTHTVIQTPTRTVNPISSLGSQKDNLVNKLGVLAGVIFGAIETSLAFRIIFKILGANANNQFISSLYQFTDNFSRPFVGIFNFTLGFDQFVLDLPAVIAMIVYSIIGYGLLWLVRLL
jgi:hypothetical protein